MTEAEWLASDDPAAMLRWVNGEAGVIPPGVQYPSSDHKLRLFADACREHFYGSATNGGTESQWEGDSRDRDERETPLRAARLWATEVSQKSLRAVLLRDIVGNPFRKMPFWEDDGHLWVPSPDSEPGTRRWAAADWLRWHGGAIPGLAQVMYESRNFSMMPVLHDLLVDAGCDDADILSHCREPLHVRGCWVVDLLLGKE